MSYDYSQTSTEVQEELFTNLTGYETRQGSYLYDITRAFSMLFSNLLTNLTEVSSLLDVDNLSGEDLERFIEQRTGITRKSSTNATGTLLVTGNGTVPAGSYFETEGLVRFEALTDTVIVESGYIDIQAVTSGTVGNVIANSITKIPITIQGITSCNNPDATSGGYEAEADTDLLERYYEKLRTPATSGNIYHYIQWAKEVTGVGDAKVLPLWNGNNTVKVLIIDNDRLPADNELIAEVQKYIDPNCSGTGEGQAPIGAYCTVVSADAYYVTVSLTIATEDGYSLSEIQTNIEDVIKDYFKELAFINSELSFAIIGARILSVEGVKDYSGLLLNDNTSNLEIDETAVFVLKEVKLIE